MDLEAVKRYLEKGGVGVDGLPARFLEPLVMNSLQVDLIEPGRIVCSMKIPQRLLNAGNSLHGGATAALVDVVGSAAIPTVGYGGANTGVSVEINVSYLDAAYADVGSGLLDFVTLIAPCGLRILYCSVTGCVESSVPCEERWFSEEIEIDARALRVGKAIAVISVEFRKKRSGKVFAQGRHTKFLPPPSKL
ncbi:hypothetical protein Fmac_001129 [Flemingia macrophylla]|uniref:Thioesterase domain-containing protein n=1 Tax=Flemingia macrophylla TaxID=520843 RepID=A0ABD1NG92_9FABA